MKLKMYSEVDAKRASLSPYSQRNYTYYVVDNICMYFFGVESTPKLLKVIGADFYLKSFEKVQSKFEDTPYPISEQYKTLKKYEN